MKNDTIEAEIVESGHIVELTQAPIITYDLVKSTGEKVQRQIDSLNIETIEATETNLSLLKTTRTSLSKDFKVYEEQRKLIKELIMKDYLKFEIMYKDFISSLFTNVDIDLKQKIDFIENRLLKQKIDFHKDYFNEINLFDFIKFEDMNLKIIRSKSDNIIKSEIDEYLLNIQTALNTIDTIENSSRVLAKFQIYKDLNRAISETNIEISREKSIAEQKAQRESQEKAQQEAYEARQKEFVQQETQQEEPIQEEQNITPQLIKVAFEVIGTIEQIRALKEYMRANNIQFGGIK